MLTIGLLGGMTCESSLEYYRLINQFARERLGGIHSAKSVMVSVDFAEIEPLMDAGRWDRVEDILVSCARQVEQGGGEFLVICTNTMHKLADRIQDQITIPILSIIDVTAEKILNEGFKTVGLLGTRFTMEQDFYRGRLQERSGLNVLIPDSDEIEMIHRVIVDELSIGKISPVSRNAYWKIINKLARRGAQGVILGCTEIPLLVTEQDGSVPLFDTTRIHAQAAVDYALHEKS